MMTIRRGRGVALTSQACSPMIECLSHVDQDVGVIPAPQEDTVK